MRGVNAVLRITAIAALALVALVGLGLATGLVRVYGVGNGALNAGVVVGTDSHNVGFEWRGEPGFFVDAN